jgi:PEP-CTERM motif-containing protein
MKLYLWAVALLLATLAECAYADNISFVTQANIRFATNLGGDNQESTLTGPGVNLSASGDVSCFWCGVGEYYLTPGSSITPSVGAGGLDWVFVQGSLTFDGQRQICRSDDDCELFATGITGLSSFTFPTNGRNFTVTVPAMLLNGTIGGELGSGDTFHQFALQIPQGRLVLSFDFVPAFGRQPAYYQFTQGAFTTTPEPSALGLMSAGLAGIVGAIMRKRNTRRCST